MEEGIEARISAEVEKREAVLRRQLEKDAELKLANESIRELKIALAVSRLQAEMDKKMERARMDAKLKDIKVAQDLREFKATLRADMKKEMKNLIDGNPGLYRRIQKQVILAGSSASDLAKMFFYRIEQNEFHL